jgi:uncharacterized short protein YbdD (DUF466 family)
MGLFKKIFKPVSKVLDKIIPNEIKPALPYLAALAPVFAPAGMQGLIGSTMGRRALTSGLLNIGGQLAQEGSEGDINLLSAGLGALTGAMTTPQGVDFSFSAPGEGPMITKGAAGIFRDKAAAVGTDTFRGKGLEALAKGSDIFAAGAANPFSMAGAKAAALPAATATGDVMQAQARVLEKQNAIDAALAEAEALADSGARAAAIRNAMNAYGFFTDEEIEETIASAGYKAGGRVGFEMGGSPALGRAMAPEEKEFKFEDIVVSTDQSQGTPLIVKIGEKFSVMVPGQDEMLSFDSEQEASDYITKLTPFKKGGRVGFKFGGIDEAIEMVEKETIEKGKEGIMQAAGEDPLLVEEYNKYVFDLMEQRPNAKPMSFQEFKRMIKAGMKDGGLMDLGGKEMDLRGGGFVPIGKKERADDVPARLSKNEFVMTADAVRAAGGGSVNEGAKRMYKVMNDLEARA